MNLSRLPVNLCTAQFLRQISLAAGISKTIDSRNRHHSCLKMNYVFRFYLEGGVVMKRSFRILMMCLAIFCSFSLLSGSGRCRQINRCHLSLDTSRIPGILSPSHLKNFKAMVEERFERQGRGQYLSLEPAWYRREMMESRFPWGTLDYDLL